MAEKQQIPDNTDDRIRSDTTSNPTPAPLPLPPEPRVVDDIAEKIKRGPDEIKETEGKIRRTSYLRGGKHGLIIGSLITLTFTLASIPLINKIIPDSWLPKRPPDPAAVQKARADEMDIRDLRRDIHHERLQAGQLQNENRELRDENKNLADFPEEMKICREAIEKLKEFRETAKEVDKIYGNKDNEFENATNSLSVAMAVFRRIPNDQNMIKILDRAITEFGAELAGGTEIKIERIEKLPANNPTRKRFEEMRGFYAEKISVLENSVEKRLKRNAQQK